MVTLSNSILVARDLTFIPFTKKSVLLNKNSEALFVLQNIRDEAHRFAIKENRRLRIKDLDLDNTLNIKGVSKSSILDLIKNLKTLNKLSNASLNELEKIISKNEAKKVYDYFNHSKI